MYGDRRIRSDERRGQSGQALPLVSILLIVAVGVLWFVVQIGARAVVLARAQTAADATALAAASRSSVTAREVAARNGASVESVVVTPGGVVATVTIDAVERLAAARRERADRRGLAPAMIAAVETTETAIGRAIPIVSGRRSAAEQQRLWDTRLARPYPVARPRTSLHEQGLAIDVPVSFAPTLARLGPPTGLCQPHPRIDPVHFELCRKKPNR